MRSAQELGLEGSKLFFSGDNEGALLHYLASIRVNPRFWPAISDAATALGALGNHRASAVMFRRALHEAPDEVGIKRTLAGELMVLGEYQEALGICEHLIREAPDLPDLWHTLALLYARTGRFNEALKAIDEKLSLSPYDVHAQNDRAHFLLSLGTNLVDAFEAYEVRWYTLRHLQIWDYGIPEWQGEPLKGKKVLFHSEQGYGDAIMCARFAKDLIKLGAEVTLGLPHNLAVLFETQNWPVEIVSIETFDENVASRFDYHTPMFSAMRWLDIEQGDICPEPYLVCPPKASVTMPGEWTNIGICWQSGKRNDVSDWRRRVTPLEYFFPFAELPNVRLCSLQVGEGEDEVEKLGAQGFIDVPKLSSWVATAALVSRLDLVVTVDTAVAHLAGALGTPVMMLSPHARCWRWWNTNQNSGMPWYKNFIIEKQNNPHDWKTPLANCLWRFKEMRQSEKRAA